MSSVEQDIRFSNRRKMYSSHLTGSFDSDLYQFASNYEQPEYTSSTGMNLERKYGEPSRRRFGVSYKNLDELMEDVISCQDRGDFKQAEKLLKEVKALQEKEQERLQLQLKSYGKDFKSFEPDNDNRSTLSRSSSSDTLEMLKENEEKEEDPNVLPKEGSKPGHEKQPKLLEKQEEVPKTPLSKTKRGEIEEKNNFEEKNSPATPPIYPQADFNEESAQPKVHEAGQKGVRSEPVVPMPLKSFTETLGLPAPELVESPFQKATTKPSNPVAQVMAANPVTSGYQTEKSVLPENRKRMVTKSGHMQQHTSFLSLFSRVNKFKVWKIRYFVLTGRFICVFASHTSRSCKQVINLTKCKVEPVILTKESTHGMKVDLFELRFLENGKDEIIRLRLSSKADTMDWFKSIKNNVVISEANSDILKRDEITRAVFTGSLVESVEEGLNEYEIIQQFWKSKYFSGNQLVRFQVNDDLSYTSEKEENIFEFYKTLKVSPTSTNSMIKKSYRKLARNLHPDKVGAEEAAQEFAYIARAFDALKFKETREQYDMCENIKKQLRQGIVCKLHQQFTDVRQVLLFIDPKMERLFIQDPAYGQVLRPGFESIELRFVTHIYSGQDGIDISNDLLRKNLYRGEVKGNPKIVDKMQKLFENNEGSRALSVSSPDKVISLHGERLGVQDWHLELNSVESRTLLVKGLRKHRCDFSELFKQRLQEMKRKGMD
eukprot:maker-scaffold_9-snap-gene-1.34-mRNA-1 protein AED:0.00 eAED:0.00 QI:38/1/1/1/1/1/2/142/714